MQQQQQQWRTVNTGISWQAVWEAATICPRPLQVDLWPFDLGSGVRVTCDVGYLGANFSLPRPLCSRLRPDVRDRQTSDAHHRLINAFLTQSAVHDVCYLVSRYDMHGARPLIHQFTASHFRLSDINSNPCSSPTPVRPLRRPRGSFHHDAAGRPAGPVRATAFAWTTSAWAVGATCTLYGQ